MGRAEVYAGVWWGNLRERNHLEDPSVDVGIILRWIFRELGVDVRERDHLEDPSVDVGIILRWISRELGVDLRERDHLEDPSVDVGIILKWISREWGVGPCTGKIWLRIGAGGGLL